MHVYVKEKIVVLLDSDAMQIGFPVFFFFISRVCTMEDWYLRMGWLIAMSGYPASFDALMTT
jgi:hypothetical protein